MNKTPVATLEEQYIIGAIMKDVEVANKIAQQLRPSDFYEPRMQELAKVCWDIVAEGRAPNLVDVMGVMMGKFGLTDIMAWMDLVYSPSVALEYVAKVKGAAQCRLALTTLGEAMTQAQNGDPSTVRDTLQNLLVQLSLEESKRARPIKDILREVFDELERTSAMQGMVGITTGFPSLDMNLGGWKKGAVTFLGGRPSMGKTVMMMQMAVGAAKKGHSVGILSMEMPAEDLAKRLISTYGPVNGQRVVSGKLKGEDWTPAANAVGMLENLGIYVDDSCGLSLTDVKAKARQQVIDHNVEVLFVDYLGLISDQTKGGSLTQEVGRIAKGMKEIARQNDIANVVLCQLSRAVEAPDNAKNGYRPQMSHLKESGDIEAAADVVALLYRPGYYFPEDQEKQGYGEVIIAKNRNGPTGAVTLAWQGQNYRFAEMHGGR